MAKEWVLNVATNRWGLNKKSVVGPVAEWIRECDPDSEAQWEERYLKRLDQFLQEKSIPLAPDDYLQSLGQRLYVKVSEVLSAEVAEVTEEDCISYIRDLVIHRTFDGYVREKETIYETLAKLLDVMIIPAPDEWDRGYNVDFFIQIGKYFIGLQIKPITYQQTPGVHNWLAWQEKNHRRFQDKFGGRVFVIFSIAEARQKKIWNGEIIEEIKAEIVRLQTLN